MSYIKIPYRINYKARFSITPRGYNNFDTKMPDVVSRFGLFVVSIRAWINIGRNYLILSR